MCHVSKGKVSREAESQFMLHEEEARTKGREYQKDAGNLLGARTLVQLI